MYKRQVYGTFTDADSIDHAKYGARILFGKIVKRIFAEEFVVVKRDPSKVQFVARLNDFYFAVSFTEECVRGLVWCRQPWQRF